MKFNEIFLKGVEAANRRLESDEQMKNVAAEYEGKKVVINVTDDAVYVFTISKEGIAYAASSSNVPGDMYLETDSQIMDEMIQGKAGTMKILFWYGSGKIKVNGIGPKEMELIRKLLGR
jgi:putative sterol carrier protein